MARNFLMSWIPKRKGWMKGYKGKQFAVSCKQLGTEATKDASWEAANAWWEAKQKEIDATEEAPVVADPQEIIRRALTGFSSPDELERLIRQGQAATQAMQLLESASVEGTVNEVLSNGQAVGPLPMPEVALERIKKGKPISEVVLDEALDNKFFKEENRAILAERLAADLRGKPVAAERTIAAQVDAWLTFLRATVANRAMSVGRYGSYDLHIHKFSAWVGGDRAIDVLSNDTLQGYWTHLSTLIATEELSRDTAKLSLMTAKQWVNWLASEKELIPYPGILRSKRLKIEGGGADPEPFTVAEVCKLLKACEGYSERTNLYLLLMLNCGMYQADISELSQSEVDWTAGTISRFRTKTRKSNGREGKGRKITYRLWPETLALLNKLRWRGEPVLNQWGEPRVLLTERGEPLTLLWIENGKQRRYDVIQSAFSRLLDRAGVTGCLKKLRKASATVLAHSNEFKGCQELLLANSPKTITDRNYVPPDQERFDKALAWLGKQFGLMS